jgi:hypothetical protein
MANAMIGELKTSNPDLTTLEDAKLEAQRPPESQKASAHPGESLALRPPPSLLLPRPSFNKAAAAAGSPVRKSVEFALDCIPSSSMGSLSSIVHDSSTTLTTNPSAALLALAAHSSWQSAVRTGGHDVPADAARCENVSPTTSSMPPQQESAASNSLKRQYPSGGPTGSPEDSEQQPQNRRWTPKQVVNGT